MKRLTFLLIASISYPLAMVPVDAQELVAPTIRIGSATLQGGSAARIPIAVDNHRNFIALQFDIAFEPSFFDQVDTSQCLSQLPDSGFLAACRRQDPPNDDVVRFLVFRWDFKPIPSGVLGDLGFRAAADGPSGVSPISALACTGQGISGNQDAVDLTDADFEPGEVVILGTEPVAAPAAPAVLDLDGVQLGSDNLLFRRELEIDSPISVLASGPEEIALKLPGGREIGGIRKRFIPRAGYIQRLDCSGNQVPDANPDTPVSFRWYGDLPDGGWLGLTVVNDIARGTLVTEAASYQISGTPHDGYRLAEIDPSNLPPSDAEAFGRNRQPAGKTPDAKLKIDTGAAVRGSGTVELDLLIMYTPQAEIDAGGPAGLNALIQQSIDNTNQAFVNSGFAGLSVREVHRELLTGFAPSGITFGDAKADLDLLRVNSQVIAARDAQYADVTMVLLRDFFNDQGVQELGFCGIANLQSPTCGRPGELPECGVGVDFEDFAISWVSTQCATLSGRNSFPHELGHLMGAEHQPGGPPLSQDPADASFAWSFAHFSLSGSPFGTLMWVPNPQELPQPLNFSNPDVLIGGQTSGIQNQRDNIRTFELLTPIMEQFRVPPPELIFEDGFE